MRRENRQWVAGREAGSLIKYGLIGKCLSSYSVELWYTYKEKEFSEINHSAGGKYLTKLVIEISIEQSEVLLNISVFQCIFDVILF